MAVGGGAVVTHQGTDALLHTANERFGDPPGQSVRLGRLVAAQGGVEIRRAATLRKARQHPDDLLDPRHLRRGRGHRAVVQRGKRRTGGEPTPESGGEGRLALDGEVQKIVEQVAPRLALHALARAVVTRDLESVSLVGQLAEADAHRSGIPRGAGRAMVRHRAMPKPATTRDPRIALERLRNQRLVGASFSSAAAAVGALGAVQAQDYYGACWGVAQRVRGATEASVAKAFDRGAILRTHVLRPTWHFVSPEDLRSLLALSHARVTRQMAPYARKAGLTARVISKVNDVLARALEGGRHLTREELAEALAVRGVPAKGERLGLMMMRAELDAIVTSGPRRGKRFTYALLDERAPKAKTLPRDEALAELARRYFTTHGPALLADFAWWAGITLAEARTAVEAARSLSERVLAERPYFSPRAHSPLPATRSSVLLLPNYDEYVISYKDYRPVFDPALASKLGPRERLAVHLLVVGGQIVGGWRRTLSATGVRVDVNALRKLSAAEQSGLERATAAYGRFLDVAPALNLRVL
jgi:hypothetical protein